jgi:hypothetical protein
VQASSQLTWSLHDAEGSVRQSWAAQQFPNPELHVTVLVQSFAA